MSSKSFAELKVGDVFCLKNEKYRKIKPMKGFKDSIFNGSFNALDSQNKLNFFMPEDVVSVPELHFHMLNVDDFFYVVYVVGFGGTVSTPHRKIENIKDYNGKELNAISEKNEFFWFHPNQEVAKIKQR